MKKTTILTIALLSALIVSCTKQEPVSLPEKDLSQKEDVAIIPVETALETMYDFLAEISSRTTKNGDERKVLSIDTHYISSRSCDAIPDAYLVNFEDDQGFAVLGANTSVAPVLAVIESGNTDWDSILHPEEEEDASGFEVGCGDPGIKPDKLLSMCISTALQGRTEDCPFETKSDSYLTDIGPLTDNLPFNQHITYCHKPNWNFVVNGCASTAIGIVVAHNNYPSIRADYELLDYSKCNQLDGEGIYYCFKNDLLYLPLKDYFTNSSSISSPSSLSDPEKIKLLTTIDNSVIKKHGTPGMSNDPSQMLFKRTEYKLTSSIYYMMDNIVLGWDATGALPYAIASALKTLGYTNVNKYQTGYLSSAQLDRIIAMLDGGKPVLMGGWTLSYLDGSHYWVVDGVAIKPGRQLIHCNWGWKGTSNGWFSTDCIKSSQEVTKVSADTSNEWNHLIVYTYDMASTTPNKIIHKLYDNRKTYK